MRRVFFLEKFILLHALSAIKQDNTVIFFIFTPCMAHPVGSALTKIKNTQTGVLDFWQDILCNSRTEFIHDLLQFGKEIKSFLEGF